jgi:HSP20 family molecular chaperone IbpA/transcriptional regulator with XRE-family HTH domain
MRYRCFTIDGPTARRLREERDLSIERLALDAGCSPRTVIALEAGKPALKSSVAKVAKALGIAPEELKPVPHCVVVPPTAPAPAGDPPPAPPRRRRLVLVYDLSPAFLENAPEEIHFILKLAEGAGTAGPVVVLDAEAGSIRLTLEVSDEDALRIVNAFLAGKLSDDKLRSVTLYDVQHPVEPESADPTQVPDFTLRQSATEMVFKAAIPGLDTVQTEIDLRANVLTINAAIKQEGEREGQDGSAYQRFGWTVMVPGDVVPTSQYANGMLEVHMAFMPCLQDSAGNAVAFRGMPPTDSQGNPVALRAAPHDSQGNPVALRAAPHDSQTKPVKIETPTTARQ